VDDRVLEAVVLLELTPGRADELEVLLDPALAGRPRKPFGQVRAVRVDEPVERLGVCLLERAQVSAVRQVEADRHRSARPAAMRRRGRKACNRAWTPRAPGTRR